MPLQVYFKDSLVKVQIGLARGKKLYDKREDIAKKDQRREAEREMKIRLRWLTNRDAAFIRQKLIKFLQFGQDFDAKFLL